MTGFSGLIYIENNLYLRKTMTRTTILTIAMLLSCLGGYARTIQGTILSATDSTTLAGANCRLLSDDRFLTADNTRENGAFVIETELKTPLNLVINLAGYSSTKIVIEPGSKNINLGKIYLDEGTTLGEVVVTADNIIQSKGRTIVFPSNADVRASASAISLFQKLPLAGLEANPITRAISIDGGSPTILINGVPSSIDDFNSLQPKDIEKIEYSRTTPARYADKGTTGFLNITLKKRNDGGQIYAWGRSALQTAFVDANIRASYHQGSSQFTLSYSPSWRNYQKVYDNTTESYIGNDFRVNLDEHDRNPFYYHNHQMQLRYDYSPSNKTLFSATFKAKPNYQKNRSIAHTVDSELGVYDNLNLTKSNSFSPSLDLFLRHDFNDNNSLEAEVVGTLSNSDYRRDNNYTFSDGTEKSYITNADSRRRSLITEVSYIHDFSQNTQLSAGFQNTVSHSKNTYLSTDYKPILTENNNYIYARISQQINKVYLSFSTGAKLYWIKNDFNKRHFIRNISTIQAQYKINSKWNLTGYFRYSPSIPSLTSLTDYPQQTSPYLISNGNPDLKVSEWFYYRLAPSFRYKKFTTSLSLQMQNDKNRVINDVSYIGNKLFLSQSINCKTSRSYSAYLSMKMGEIYGFGLNADIAFNRYEFSGIDWSHKLNSFNGSFTIWWNKGPYTVSYWRKVPGKYMNGHSVSKDENGDTLEFFWEPNKHWTIGASWMYMFDKKGTRYPRWNYSDVNPYFRERYIENNSNMVVISVRYSTDFGSIFKTARRNLNNSDNGSSLLKL